MIEDRLLTTKEVLEMVKIGRTTLWRMVKECRFPKPLMISMSSNRWSNNEIIEWIEELKKKRDSV